MDDSKEVLDMLRKLCGYWQNDTQRKITIAQDDATRHWILRWGDGNTEWAWGATLREVIRNAAADDQNRELIYPGQ